ncbi:GntR family transcriptional regulator [Bacillus cereus]|nr:GntR family transcriptional regulator [Bacillus cereus]
MKGSNYAVENPGYHRKMVVFEQGEEKVQMLSLDRDGICMADLENSNANVVFVTPSHQFPYGMIMPITRRTQLLQWAKKEEDRYIIEDDYDSEFRYSGKPIRRDVPNLCLPFNKYTPAIVFETTGVMPTRYIIMAS